MTAVDLRDIRIDTPHGRVVALCKSEGRAPVVLLHGNSSCKEVFARQLEMLCSQDLCVLVPDLPGHGASDDADDPVSVYSFPGYAAAICKLIDHLGWETIHLIGWSLGGHVALELMAHDARVRSLMLIGTPPLRPSLEALTAAFLTSAGMDLAGKQHFSEGDARCYGGLMLGTDVPPHLLKAAMRTDGQARFHMINNGISGIGADQRHLVETDPRPVAVLHGRKDPFVSLTYLQGICYRNPWRSGVQILETGGHAPHWERPAEFNKILQDWLFDVTHPDDPLIAARTSL